MSSQTIPGNPNRKFKKWTKRLFKPIKKKKLYTNKSYTNSKVLLMRSFFKHGYMH